MRATVHIQEITGDVSIILVDVLSSVLSEEAVPTSDPLPPGPLAVARLAIHDHLADEYSMVEVRLGVSLATTISARMLSVAAPTPDDVVDAVAELGNIAGGNVKTLLCQHGRLSLPSAQIAEQEPFWPLEYVTGAAYVRAIMLGHVAQLAVVPGADPMGLLWPATDPDEPDDHPGRIS
jgi:hypothetical protein